MLDLDNMTTIDVILNGQTIALTEVEVIKNGVATTVWRAEQYIFQNGTLASGLSLSNFTNTDGYLHAGVGADDIDVSYDTTAQIQNIDFTNYSKLDIVLDYNNYANFGSSDACYGIDNCWTTELPDSNNERITTTITIDISSYTGTHYIGFGLTCENNSSEPTWGASSNVWISEIKLYN